MDKKKIVVLGGGYAGLACLSELSRRHRKLDLHLIDAAKDHCRVTCLHKTFHTPLKDFLKPFDQLGKKFRFRHHCCEVKFGFETLENWCDRKKITLQGEGLPFDALVLATGSRPVRLSGGQNVFDLSHLRKGMGAEIIDQFCSRWNGKKATVTFVGGGATGIQALFEALHALTNKGFRGSFRLVSRTDGVVPELPPIFHNYIVRRMVEAGVEYLSQTTYLGSSEENVLLKNMKTGEESCLSSQLTFLFPGAAPSPLRFETNANGQVLLGRKKLDFIFAAGDCSLFMSSGLNHMTAQAAIQKGRLVARNVLSYLEGKSLEPYNYREKGYFISLGPADAIGWVGIKHCIVKGVTAMMLKEAAETQFELFLGGVNTYDLLPGL